jgi:hypothetical protein
VDRAAAGWTWIRNPWFRYAHLGAIAFVAGEAVLGYACPLTIWEDMLRGGVRPESFIGRWVYRVLYYRAPEWVFTTAYAAWAAATVITLILLPPRKKDNHGSHEKDSLRNRRLRRYRWRNRQSTGCRRRRHRDLVRR